MSYFDIAFCVSDGMLGLGSSRGGHRGGSDDQGAMPEPDIENVPGRAADGAPSSSVGLLKARPNPCRSGVGQERTTPMKFLKI